MTEFVYWIDVPNLKTRKKIDYVNKTKIFAKRSIVIDNFYVIQPVSMINQFNRYGNVGSNFNEREIFNTSVIYKIIYFVNK